MKEIFRLKTFWAIFLIVSGVIYIALTNLNHIYQTEIDVLIIPKNNLTVKNSNQIIENLKHIPLTLSFYEKLIQENGDDFNDSVLELPDYRKQIYWNSKIRISKVEDSDILKIIVFGNSIYQSENLSREVLKTFLTVTSSYYNIKTDLDIRIINKPVTNFTYKTSICILFLESLLGSFILVLLVFWFSFSLFEKELFFKTKTKTPKLLFDYNSFNNSNQKKPQEALSLKNSLKNVSSFSIGKEKKAQAPNNLPLAPVSFLENTNQKKSSTKKNPSLNKIDKEKKLDSTREATPEEVKARLNKLLSGK